MDNELHFSNNNNCWETPQTVFDILDAEFHFNTDVCATKKTAKCEHFYTPKENGLLQKWSGVCWMNPSYSNADLWVRKAYEEAEIGNALTVALLAARTCTKWFHNYCYNKHEIRFWKGRMKFVGAKDSAPFPSMFVIFRPFVTKRAHTLFMNDFGFYYAMVDYVDELTARVGNELFSNKAELNINLLHILCSLIWQQLSYNNKESLCMGLKWADSGGEMDTFTLDMQFVKNMPKTSQKLKEFIILLLLNLHHLFIIPGSNMSKYLENLAKELKIDYQTIRNGCFDKYNIPR